MKYRPIGKTGLSASIIGLGAEYLDRKPYTDVERTIHCALDQGISMIDTFMPGDEIRENIGKALRGRRHNVHIQGHICSVDIREQYDISRDLDVCKHYFEKQLKLLDTDYLDFGMLFFMDSEDALNDVINNGIYDYMLDQKKRGTVRFIGASSHNPFIAKRMIEDGMIEHLMFSINAAFDLSASDDDVLTTLGSDEFSSQIYTSADPARAELYKLCEQKGIGITVMKSLGSGKLLSAEHTPFSRAMTVPQCIHYALTRPAVASVLVGCQSPEEIMTAVSYLDSSDEDKDFTSIIETYKSNMKGACVYCRHCQPCPSDIDIAEVNKYLDIALLDTANIPPGTQNHYHALSAHGSDCIECGSCEAKCPFSVPIIRNMKQAVKLFGE